VQDFLSVAALLKKPQLAQLYASLAHEDEATVPDVRGDLELAQGTAYSYVNRLVNTGVVESRKTSNHSGTPPARST
jgi:predicted transcriptional regulator